MKYLILFFLFIVPLLSFGQKKPKCSVGRAYEAKKLSLTGASYKMVVSPDGKIAVKIYQDKEGLSIQYYDALTMKLKKESNSPEKRTELNIIDIGHYDGKLMLIYQKSPTKYRDVTIACREINTQTYTLGAEKMLIEKGGDLGFHLDFSFNDIVAASQNTYYVPSINSNSTWLSRSQDNSKLLIYFRLPPEGKNDAYNYDVISFYLFDEQLNQLAHEEVKMPYTEQQMDNHSFCVSSEGVPYLLARVRDDGTQHNYNSKAFSNTMVINYHFELLRIDLSNHSIIKTRIEEKNKHLLKIKLLEDYDKNIICAATYINTNDKFVAGDIDGMGIFRVNKKGIVSKAFYDLPIELLTLYENPREAANLVKKEKKDIAKLHNFHLSNVLVQKDNGVVFSGEETYIHSSQTTTWYHYNNIITVKIGGDNKLAWMKKLPKRQIASSMKNSFSFRHFHLNNKHYLLFLDHEDNKKKVSEKGIPAEIKNKRACDLRAFVIDDATGLTQKISLFNTHDIKGDLKILKLPVYHMNNLSDNQLIMQAEKAKKEEFLIRIDL